MNAMFSRFCLFLGLIAAQHAAGSENLFTMPERPELAKVHLLTVGLGEEIYTRYGHTMVRIEDIDTNHVQLLNWGLFDFDAPNFGLNFFRGRLIYMMGASDLARTIHLYEQREKRKVWQQEIRLTPDQKKQFLDLIYENGKPENIRYPYQYFYNNCATVVRDFLDKVFDGELGKYFSARVGTKYFRDYVYGNLNKPPPVAMFLDITMNSRLDFPLSEWHEMFMPERISTYFQQYPSRLQDEQGKFMPLLSTPVTLVEHGDYPPSPWDAYELLLVFGVTPILWFGLLLGPKFRYLTMNFPQARTRVRLALHGLGLMMTMYFLTSFLLGFAMLASWLFSEHLDLHHNMNLFIFWPLDFICLPLSLYLLFRGRLPDWQKWRPKLRLYAYLHLVAALAFVMAYVFGLTAQNISRVVLFAVPVQVLLIGIFAKICGITPHPITNLQGR